MDTTYAEQAIRTLAQREGVAESQVITEIDNAIQAAMAGAYSRGDQAQIHFWETISSGSSLPSALDFIAFLSSQIANAP